MDPPLTAGRPMMDVRVAGLVNVITTIVAVMFVIVAVAAAEVEAAIGGAPIPMITTTAPGRGCLGRRMHVTMANAAIVTNDGMMRVAIRVSNNATIEIEEIQSTG